jgi:methyl-accepting chemotaxis protein
MLNNLKIGVRLGIGFAVTLALLVTIAVVSYVRLGALNDNIELMVNDRFPKTVQANDMIDAVNNIARLLRNAYIYSGAEQQKALDGLAPQRKIITENLEKLEKTIKSEKGREILKHIGASRTAYVATQDKFLELLKADKKADIVALMQGDLRKTQTDYMASINALIKFQTDAMNKAGKDADELVAATERLIVILGVIASLLTAIFGWFITRSITRPVGEALAVTQRLAEGDLTVSINDVSKDEIGQMLGAQQGLIAKLNQIIGEVKGAADALSNAAGQVSATAQSLSQSSSEQAASVEETTASIEQMTASITQNTENAKVTDNMATKSSVEATQGGTGGEGNRGSHEVDRRQDRDHRRHRLPDQPAGAERRDRSGTGRRARQGLRGRGGRGTETGRTQPGGGAGDRTTGRVEREDGRRSRQAAGRNGTEHQEDLRPGAGNCRR